MTKPTAGDPLIADGYVVVCVACRRPLGAGQHVMVWNPTHFRDACAATGRQVPPLGDDDPVIVCLPCGEPLQDARRRTRPQ